MGVECEREGDLFEATRYYKRALKLDPDVEKLIAEEDAASRSMDTTSKHESCLLSIYGVHINFFYYYTSSKR